MQGRVAVVQDWLARRADNPLGRFALAWFRRYFEASRNSGSAATMYLILSVGPLLLAATGLFHAAGRDTNTFAQRLIEHQHLNGATARLVRETFGTASQNAVAASVLAIIGFLGWGLGVGQIYKDFYARAWRMQVRSLSDQARFAIWFFVLSGAVGLFIVFAASVRSVGWGLFVLVWIVVTTAFWVWTPYFLLHGRIGLRPLLPGAFLTALAVGVATSVSRFFLGSDLNSSGKAFGAFGVVLALLAWSFTLTTITLACAVLSPVWAERREQEAHRASRQ
jgi:uncharacterized BrkB/YihY/UPF0761 family membrane protein